MATNTHNRFRMRLFPKEHREARGISATQMADYLGIERESIYRLEREWLTRMTPEKQLQYTELLEIDPRELWQLPGELPSLDVMLDKIPDDKTKKMIVEVVLRLLADH